MYKTCVADVGKQIEKAGNAQTKSPQILDKVLLLFFVSNTDPALRPRGICPDPLASSTSEEEDEEEESSSAGRFFALPLVTDLLAGVGRLGEKSVAWEANWDNERYTAGSFAFFLATFGSSSESVVPSLSFPFGNAVGAELVWFWEYGKGI
jgi:hypothetical protein